METFLGWLFFAFCCVVFVGMAMIFGVDPDDDSFLTEKEKLKKKEKENTELINKALKHYAETKGIK